MTYAGDVSPRDAYELLAANPDTVLIDVRTPAELSYVGLPDLAGIEKQVVPVPWHPQLTGEQLAAQLTAAGVESTDQLLFICRSGVRSAQSAKLATAKYPRQSSWALADPVALQEICFLMLRPRQKVLILMSQRRYRESLVLPETQL